MVERYRACASGPLLDRIDLQVAVPVPSLRELRQEPGEPSRAVAARVVPAHVAEAVQYRTFDRPTLRDSPLGRRANG